MIVLFYNGMVIGDSSSRGQASELLTVLTAWSWHETQICRESSERCIRRQNLRWGRNEWTKPKKKGNEEEVEEKKNEEEKEVEDIACGFTRHVVRNLIRLVFRNVIIMQ